MADVLITQPQDDEIVLSLITQKMVTHDTVRLQITVSAQRGPETDEKTLRTQIAAALRNFINADWRYIGVSRNRGQTRFENVVVTAIARVPEAENKDLVERASAVSKPGLELVNPIAAYALPFDEVRRINSDLRLALVKLADEECGKHNDAQAARRYRVGLIEFADTPRIQGLGGDFTGQFSSANNMRASSAYAGTTYPGSTTAGVGEVDTEEGAKDLGVSERFWVAAQVTLRAARPTTS